ncbi:NADH ubiquinone oxidoreductase subunit NDUFA12 domain-containing protein [Ditylenchus destructor]|nr:NADH ubiquinone oxidoreductase subunit NDUFA12 domain-containing protein [Ditylenchus destructor]
MSRPAPWTTVWRNFLNSLSRNQANHANRSYIGEDMLGNRYYEIKESRSSNVKRGYDPPEGQRNWQHRNYEKAMPPVEWQGWLNGSRKLPPTSDEIALNQKRQQAQLKEDAETERRAPIVGSTGKGAHDVDRGTQYPKYEDIEMAPGVIKTEDPKKENK